MTYSEQIKSPEWKKKRLRILYRDNHKCMNCNSKIKLQVHHIGYIKDRLIHEYEDEMLITLCSSCRQILSELKLDLKQFIDNNFVYPKKIQNLVCVIGMLSELSDFEFNELNNYVLKKYIQR